MSLSNKDWTIQDTKSKMKQNLHILKTPHIPCILIWTEVNLLSKEFTLLSSHEVSQIPSLFLGHLRTLGSAHRKKNELSSTVLRTFLDVAQVGKNNQHNKMSRVCG